MNYDLISNVSITGIDPHDYPDFSDAYIESASYAGREMTDAELDLLNEDTEFIHEKIMAIA